MFNNRTLFVLVLTCMIGPAFHMDAARASESLRPDFSPRKRSARPSPHWQLQRALPAPRKAFTEGGTVVDVAAAAAETPVGGGDVLPNIDVQITQEIMDKATELGTPRAMYEFVRNECAFQPYYGSQKGSVETLRQRAGNDYDLASLLIALLRSQGYPARYADGIIEMTAADATSWLKVNADNGSAAGSILFTHGMEGVSLFSGSPDNIVAVRCRRVWVEAFIPSGFGSPTWRPLDPAFARHSVDSGQDIPEAMTLDVQAFVDNYWDPTDGATLPRPETIVELLEQQLQAYLDVNQPGTSVDDVKRQATIIAEHLGLLPPSLPYIVRTRDNVFDEIPADRRYQIRFHLYDGATNLIDATVNLPEIAGRRVTIDYEGATPGDQAIIDANEGIYFTDPSTVDLRPLLRIDGSLVATGAAGIGMGLVHASDVHFIAPTNNQGLPFNVVPSISNQIISGASQAVGLAVEGAAENLLIAPPADDTEGTLSLLYDTAMDYMAFVREDALTVGSLMHGVVTTGVTSAIVENVVSVTYDGFGVPQTFEWVGLRVDADRSVVGYWPVDRFVSGDTEPAEFLIVSGAEGSLWENRIFENGFDQNSVSTIKILALAVDSGVTVYKRWNSLPLPANTQPVSVQNAIANAIAGGQVVTFPADPMTIGLWTGTGWIDQDPNSGAAGYLISGGINGGATVEVWPPEFIDLSSGDRSVVDVEIEITSPDADSPDADSVFTRDNEENLEFEYLVHVTYDDASMNTLGPFTKRTRNTTKTFSPGNYTFHVWIARWLWWGTLAEAERKVSIVGVLIREDDGTDEGKDPPKYLQIRPPMEDTCPRPIKALVIPEEAPDGSPLASAYSWSGDSKVAFDMPMAQVTEIEPMGQDASADLEDQMVEVEVTLPGGKSQKGYRKFDFAAGGMDEPYKLTVIKVEMVLHKPLVIDTGEAEIPENEKKSIGAQTFVNLDNDDDDANFDTGTTDTDVAGEDEMIKVDLKLQPATLDEGNVTLEAMPGAANIKVWEKNNKDTEYTLGTDLGVADKFMVDGDALVLSCWVEGVMPHTAQQGTILQMKYDEVEECMDEAAITVVGIESIEWVGRNNSRNDNNTLDADPNWPAGVVPGAVRVFPGARATGATSIEADPRDDVDVKVTLTVQPVRDLDLHFDSYDVDDPTKASAPVDDESGDEDNRGTAPARSGMFDGEAMGIKTQTFDAKEETFMFQVTMNPGDNFRVVGSGDADALADLVNEDSAAGASNNDKQRIVNQHVTGTLTAKEVRERDHYASNVLTVWRFLHMEVDSMVAVPAPPDPDANRVTTTLTEIRAGTTELVVGAALNDGSPDLDDGAPGNGRFERGEIEIGTGGGAVTVMGLVGNGDDFVRHSAAVALPFTVTAPAGPSPPPNATGNVTALSGNDFTMMVSGGALVAGHVGGMLEMAGETMTIAAVNPATSVVTVTAHSIDVELADDDDEMLLPMMPDFSGMAGPFGDAYILPLMDGGTDASHNQNNLVFTANEGAANLDMNNMMQDTPVAVEQDRFWVGYLASAYQYNTDSDDDPNLCGAGCVGEGGTGGVCFSATSNAAVATGGDAAWVFQETCRDRMANDVPMADAGLDVRDAAHETGHMMGLSHLAGTLMNSSLQMIQPNPSFGDTHLDLLRSRVRSPGQ